MSAEGNLSDPTIFAKPPSINDVDAKRIYWRDPHNQDIGGYRIDGVFRKYMDIIHRHVLEQEPPQRPPLYLPGDAESSQTMGAAVSIPADLTSTPASQTTATTRTMPNTGGNEDEADQPAKKQKRRHDKKGQIAAVHNPNLKALQGHLFQLLRCMLSTHVPIRDALARARAGDIQAFENVLSMVEAAVKQGLDEENAAIAIPAQQTNHDDATAGDTTTNTANGVINGQSSATTKQKYKRPFWVCQPHIRPLPDEALKIGAMTLSKKDKEKLAQEMQVKSDTADPVEKDVKSQAAVADALQDDNNRAEKEEIVHELPNEEALACG